MQARTDRKSYFAWSGSPRIAIYTLSLHDALPILPPLLASPWYAAGGTVIVAYDEDEGQGVFAVRHDDRAARDRKSTRLNSSHVERSYAAFRFKKKRRPGHRSPRLRPPPDA